MNDQQELQRFQSQVEDLVTVLHTHYGFRGHPYTLDYPNRILRLFVTFLKSLGYAITDETRVEQMATHGHVPTTIAKVDPETSQYVVAPVISVTYGGKVIRLCFLPALNTLYWSVP